MRKLHIRQYEPDDYLKIEVSEAEKQDREYLPIEYIATNHKTAGPSGTVTNDAGEIVACFGLTLFWSGTAEAWLICSQNVRNHIRLLHVCREALAFVRHRHDLKRIQAHVISDHDEAIRFVQHLGFKFEGRLRKYGPRGRDNDMYAWTED